MTSDIDTGTVDFTGSADFVSEFFVYAINNILYQRGIYPPDSFIKKKKYGVSLLVTTNQGILDYMNAISKQLNGWLKAKSVESLVLVIASVRTNKTLERWVFDVSNVVGNGSVDTPSSSTSTQNSANVTKQVQAVIRQITGSVAMLPLLNDSEPCSFDLLVYTKGDVAYTKKWEESGPRDLPKAQKMNLRSFTTTFHNVNTRVEYASS